MTQIHTSKGYRAIWPDEVQHVEVVGPLDSIVRLRDGKSYEVALGHSELVAQLGGNVKVVTPRRRHKPVTGRNQ